MGAKNSAVDAARKGGLSEKQQMKVWKDLPKYNEMCKIREKHCGLIQKIADQYHAIGGTSIVPSLGKLASQIEKSYAAKNVSNSGEFKHIVTSTKISPMGKLRFVIVYILR